MLRVSEDDRHHLFGAAEAHDRVGVELAKNDGRVFLSSWNGSHPFVADFLGGLPRDFAAATDRMTSYSHLDDDGVLADSLGRLHRDVYREPPVEPARFSPGAGASSFLATLVHYVRRLGFDELCYVPPVFHNAIYWIRELRFSVTRVVDRAIVDGGPAELRLPDRRTCLWITDPVWFAGKPLSAAVIARIADWQRATSSVVVVDGTFQYMSWAGPRAELSSTLAPDLTFRLVCPTKALSMHGFRFAYTITPAEHAADFVTFHSRMHGASSLSERMFAHRAVHLLASGATDRLWTYVRDRYEELGATGAIAEHVPPDTGYFVFCRPRCPVDEVLALVPACFEVKGYEGHVRLNLLDDGVHAYLRASARVDSWP